MERPCPECDGWCLPKAALVEHVDHHAFEHLPDGVIWASNEDLGQPSIVLCHVREEPNSDRLAGGELLAEILHPAGHRRFVFGVDVGFEHERDGQLYGQHVGRLDGGHVRFRWFLFAVFDGCCYCRARCNLMMAQHPDEGEVVMIEQMPIANEAAVVLPDPVRDVLGNDAWKRIFELQSRCVRGCRGCRRGRWRRVDPFVEEHVGRMCLLELKVQKSIGALIVAFGRDLAAEALVGYLRRIELFHFGIVEEIPAVLLRLLLIVQERVGVARGEVRAVGRAFDALADKRIVVAAFSRASMNGHTDQFE